MISEINSIVEKVKLGMKRAYIDTLNFTGDPSQKFGAEYLFTVNVAKAIGELNIPHGDPYRIYIEKRTQDVARNCLPILKREKGGGFVKNKRTVFRADHALPTIERNGRIDIAVYKEDKDGYLPDHVPFCIIELKSFNPARKLVIKDLKRNVELLRASGPTGTSSIQASIFSAVHQIMSFDTDEQVKIEEKRIISNYEKWYSGIGNINELNIVTRQFSLSREMVGEIAHEIDGDYVDTSTRHCFIGIIVIITLKNNNILLE